MELCEDQFAQLEKVQSCLNLACHVALPNQSLHVWRPYQLFISLLQLQNEIIMCEPDFCENPTEQVR